MKHEDIFFYDFSFSRLAQFKEYISVNIELKYCSFGTFEAHFSTDTEKLTEILFKNEFLLCKYGNVWAVVTGKRISTDIAVFGRTPEWLLTKRCTEPFTAENKKPSELAAYAVQAGAGDFVSVSQYTASENTKDYSTDKLRTVYDTVCESLSESGLGFRLTPLPTEKKFAFEIYEGTERLRAISASELTAYDMTYTSECLNFVNSGGWYERCMKSMGTWNAKKNSPSISDNKSENAYTYYRIIGDTYTRFGLSCEAGDYIYSDSEDGKWKIGAETPKNVWVKLEYGDAEGACKWEAVLSGQNTAEEAASEFAKMKTETECEASVRRLEYGTDYNLGDIMRVRFEFGNFRATEKRRVCGIMIYADENESGTRPELEKITE